MCVMSSNVAYTYGLVVFIVLAVVLHDHFNFTGTVVTSQ